MKDFDLRSTLYKRRNGFGKHAESSWVPRCFTLHGSVLCYYEEDQIEFCDPSRPRGRVDLDREDTKTTLMNVKKPGAPTSYLVVLQIFVLSGLERKWKLCCLTRSQQQSWYNALKAYDGPPAINLGENILDFLSFKPQFMPNSPRIRKPTAASRIAREISRASFAAVQPDDRKGRAAYDNKRMPELIIVAGNILAVSERERRKKDDARLKG